MKKIALFMELSDFYEHGIAKGVVRYAKSQPDWRLFGYGWMFRPLADVGAWHGDGIIARIESPEDADRIESLGVPVVDVAGAYSRPGFRTIANDDFLTGYKAALHLRSCGFEHFAFLGVRGTIWSDERKEGFLKGIGAASKLPVFERPLAWWEDSGGSKADSGRVNYDVGRLKDFLQALPKPAAIFACNDTAGLRATELAREAGIAVPDSLAILGVDDEDILCELASPSLSSIRLDCETIGYRAAQALDAILAGGGSPASSRIAVPPKDVMERESTRIFVCPDSLVAAAVTLIRARAHEGIGVPDLLAVLPCSRRSLEKRFRASLGRSLHEEILRVRLARARRLLLDTDFTVERIAEDCGFGSLPRFNIAFRSAEGLSPGAWRRRRAYSYMS
ncbi:MAG TPA: DNA-binding transcriptional regulator [Rectinemataceae bacterium]